MSAGRRRFVLVDPCLTGRGSHPFHFAREVLAAAAARGCDCTLAAWHGFRPDDCPATWRVHTPFRHTSYSKYTAFGELDALDERGRVPLAWRLQPTAWWRERRREQRIAAFAEDVRPAIAGLNPGDVVLLATASELEAAGLARAIADLEPPRGIGWHILFHFPIYRGFGPEFPTQDRRLEPTRRRLHEAVQRAVPHVIHWHTTTPELACQYARILPGPVADLPYPIPQLQDRAPWRAGPLRAVSLGDARPEKRTATLPDIVTACHAALPGSLEFAIQTNLGFPAGSRHPEHEAVRTAIDELRRLAERGQQIDLLGGPLDAPAYAAELLRADAVLLPYDQDRYRSRCSGVMLEALAAAATPIVTGGGWMARQLAEPLRVHAKTLAARGRPLHDERISGPRPTRERPFALPLATGLQGCGVDQHGIVVVESRWSLREDASLHAVPLRIAVGGGGPRPATMLSPDVEGRPAVACFALAPADIATGGLRLEFQPGSLATTAEPEELRVRCLAAEGPLPTSAVGIVVDSPADVAAALGEFTRHAAHYRETAAAHAPLVREACSGTAVVDRLLP